MRRFPVIVLSCTLIASSLIPVQVFAQAGSYLCRQDLDRTRTLFRERVNTLPPATAEAIADQLDVLESSCLTQNSQTVSAEILRLQDVLNGRRPAIAEIPEAFDNPKTIRDPKNPAYEPRSTAPDY